MVAALTNATCDHRSSGSAWSNPMKSHPGSSMFWMPAKSWRSLVSASHVSSAPAPPSRWRMRVTLLVAPSCGRTHISTVDWDAPENATDELLGALRQPLPQASPLPNPATGSAAGVNTTSIAVPSALCSRLNVPPFRALVKPVASRSNLSAENPLTAPLAETMGQR